jgi:hypothetical protein
MTRRSMVAINGFKTEGLEQSGFLPASDRDLGEGAFRADAAVTAMTNKSGRSRL